MNSTTNYIEFQPAPRFREHFVSFWRQHVDGHNAGFMQPVFPDGCVDILWRNDADAIVVGSMTKYRQAILTSGLYLAGIRLFPGRLAALARIPASEITDLEIPLSDIIGRRKYSGPLFNADKSALLIEGELYRRAAGLLADDESSAPDAEIISLAVRRLATNPGLSIQQLASHFEMGERRLHRLFARTVGFGPKLFQRIARFQRFLQLVRHPTAPASPAPVLLALEAGYADQAHLNRDCREFSGRSPVELSKDSHFSFALSDLFNTNSL